MRLLAVVIASLGLAAQSPTGDAHDDGRALFLRLGCVHCHAEVKAGALTAQSPGAPDLRKAGARLQPGWIAEWLAAPSAVKPGARMPALLTSASDARDLASYLGGLGRKQQDLENPWRDEDGEKLFTKRGCVACHLATPATNARDTRMPLSRLGAKTNAHALADFLEHPLELWPKGLMPDLALSRDEARQIAGFLCTGPASPAPEPGDAARGKRRFSALRCGACHQGPDDAKPVLAPPLSALPNQRGGCLAPKPPEGLPRYDLSDRQRAALLAFLADPARPEPASDELARRTLGLGCVRCHAFATGGGMPGEVLQEVRDAIAADTSEGVDPPDLASAGQRLRLGYVRDVLEGNRRARPYMELRMPRFPKDLVRGLAGAITSADAPPVRPSTLEEVDAGRRLLGAGGFSCITCHDFAGQASVGQRGPDLTQMHARLLPEFLRSWISSPSAIRKGTRMPTFFHDGRSAITGVLDGDAEKQLDALMACLALGPRMNAPEGLRPPGDTVIRAKDMPIVLRTEFPDTSVRSLAIGFPSGLSLCLETGKPALAYVWQGGFVDMRRKWSGRGDGPCDLVGGKVHSDGMTPLWGGPTPRFSGYEIHADLVLLAWDRGTGNQVELRVAQRQGAFGQGLSLQVTSARAEAVTVRLGRLAPGAPRDPVLGSGTKKLGILSAPPECATCACGETVVTRGQDVGFVVPAHGSAEAVLWFVSCASAEVQRELLGAR